MSDLTTFPATAEFALDIDEVAAAGGPVGNWMERLAGGFCPTGLPGQFGVEFLLGAVWSLCIDPTLGATLVMAARAENLWSRK